MVASVAIGHDTDYLTDAVAKGREGYYTGAVAAGEPPGIWHGAGAAELGLTGEVDAEVMKALYTHGLDPRDPNTGSRATWGEAERLGNAPRNYRKAEEIYAGLLDAHPGAGPEERAELRAQAASSARQSVAFYDATYSAPKSLTVMWVAFERAASEARAAGDDQAADEWAAKAGMVEESVRVGHRAVLDFYADRAGYARAGHHGGGAGQWVDAHGLVAASFLQHDSRDGDPQLHAHGAILNKARCPDGKWRALDGSLLYQWKGAAGAHGDRAAEAWCWQQLGAAFEARPDGKAREVAAIDPASRALFSQRRAAIEPAGEKLIAAFTEANGRAPSGHERAALMQQATLETRKGKSHDGIPRDEQLTGWAQRHAEKLGQDLVDVAHAVTDRPAGQPAMWSERDVIARALEEVKNSKQSWTRSDLTRAVSDALPAHLGIGPQHVGPLLESLTDKAETHARTLNDPAGPSGLEERYYRADGSSVFVKPGARRFATDDQLLGEQYLRDAAIRRGAPAWNSEDADAVLGRFADAGRELGVDQAAALRGILTSGAAVEVLAAPAGTGKSFLVGTLAETWPHAGLPAAGDPSGGPDPAGEGPRVFGVAYGQRQAEVLAEEGVTARNIRAWLDAQTRLDHGTTRTGDEALRLRAGDMLVVDEAGAAATPDLAAITRRCEQQGVKLLLVGDAKQLGAVGAGGALSDVAARAGSYELAEVRRFADQWEGPASLRLRDGDPTVVAEYVKHGRLENGGTREQAEAKAARLWLDSTLRGNEALLVVGSNEAAARTSQALRAELVRLGQVAETGVPLGRAGWEGTVAGVGDLVQARSNGWHLGGFEGNQSVPLNRFTYRVTGIRPDGLGLVAARVTGRDETGAEVLAEPIQLPASYVAEHVTLAYASTVHAAHGRTVDDGISVVGQGTDCGTAYTQLTRGRGTNLAVMVTRQVAEGADTGETFDVAPRDPAAVLTEVIRPPEQDPNTTALAQAEAAAEHERHVATHVDPMLAVVADATAGRTARWLDQLAADGDLPEQHRVALAADEARSSLDQLLRTAELAGHDPAEILRDAVTSRSLDGSASVAQVVHFRIRTALDGRLDANVSTFADLLPRDLPEQSRLALDALARAGDARRAELGTQLAKAPPQWAREAIGPVPEDPAERATWEQRAGRVSAYREWIGHTGQADPLGPAPAAGLVEKHALYRDAHAALDLPDAGADEEQASEGLLRARVAAWEREQQWAPRYVADELDATHEALRQRRADATLYAAHADAATDPHEAEQLHAAAAGAQAAAEQLAEQVTALERADAARTAWTTETAITRDKAERGRVALGLRGIDLDAPHERVTAQEWLDAEEADRLADDPDREIREDYELERATERAPIDGQDSTADDSRASREPVRDDDVLPSEDAWPDESRSADGPERGTEQVVETRIPDVRETAVRDDTEHADPAERRRVPSVDETIATAHRAHLATVEIANRRRLDDAADHDPDRDADDDRREDLNRWAAAADDGRRPESRTDDTEPGRERDADDAEVLER